MTTATDKLLRLVAACKAGVSLEFNQHRNSYESIEDYLYHFRLPCDAEEVLLTPEELERCKAADTLVQLQCYPRTPVGFTILFGATLDEVLDKALAYVEPPAA